MIRTIKYIFHINKFHQNRQPRARVYNQIMEANDSTECKWPFIIIIWIMGYRIGHHGLNLHHIKICLLLFNEVKRREVCVWGMAILKSDNGTHFLEFNFIYAFNGLSFYVILKVFHLANCNQVESMHKLRGTIF